MSDARAEDSWTAFDQHPESACFCRCGAEYRSHAKYVAGFGLVTRKPCPSCEQHNDCYRVSSDPETMTL